MIILRRINRIGLEYLLSEVVAGETTITQDTNTIIIKHPIDKISQAWYHWQMGGAHIQTAFDFLSAAEREFLITGLTEAKWNEIFSEEEN